MNLNALRGFIQRVNPEETAAIQLVQQNALVNKDAQLKYNQNLNTQDLQMVKFSGQLATALKSVPMEQRPSVYAQYAPILKRNQNFDDQDEALFQTDQGLDQIINTSKFLIKPETYKLGADESLYQEGTNALLARGASKPNNYDKQNQIDMLKLQAQIDQNRATRESTDAYRSGNQDMQRLQMLLAEQNRQDQRTFEKQKFDQGKQEFERQYGLSERRINADEAQIQSQRNKAIVAKNKTLLPYSEAIASIQNTMDAANTLIFDPKNPGKVDPRFAGATGAIDQYTGALGEMMGTKEGVKSRDIERFVNSKIIPLAESLKPLSNSDIAFVKTTFPSKGSSVKSWLSWYQTELPSILKLAEDKMNAAASAYDIDAPAGVYEGAPVPTAPQGPMQFKSSSGISFEVQ